MTGHEKLWRQLSDAQALALRRVAGGEWEIVEFRSRVLGSSFALRECRPAGRAQTVDRLHSGTVRVLCRLGLIEESWRTPDEIAYAATATGRDVVPRNVVRTIEGDL